MGCIDVDALGEFIARFLGGALDFASTLLATLVGAAVALAGSWALSRRGERERYQVRLDEALGAVIVEARTLMEANTPILPQMAAHVFDGSPVDVPSTASLSAALEGARLVARGDDRGVIESFRKLIPLASRWNIIGNVETARFLIDTLTDWRASDAPHSTGTIGRVHRYIEEHQAASG